MTTELPLDPDSVITECLVQLSELPTEKTACIEELLSLAVAAGRVTNLEAAHESIFAREATATTAMGNGIAMPHAKTAAVETPTVVFGRSLSGVGYETPDGEPVELVVLLLMPADAIDAHLTVLSQISRSLVDPAVRDHLRDAPDASAVVTTLRSALVGEADAGSEKT
ncbi:PTS sugar transporter subunit IIA [Halorubrum sp. N11]|uniref:PTS sugar transporter subunit IIA n=1 Tax=Halorubrum sp. N11 TaxID=3402276 RepID=UPI003EBF00C5